MRKCFTIEHTLEVERHSERRTRLLQHAHSTNQIGVCFADSNACPFLFPSFYFCPSYFCFILLLLLLNHSIDTLRCYSIFSILLSVTSRSKRIPDDQPTLRTVLSRERVSALLSQLPQRRYRIALPILLVTYGATSGPSTLMCLPKSPLNQTSYSTSPPPLNYA